MQVDDGKVLTLSGTEISGGTINVYNGLLGGTINVIGDSTIDGHATLNNGAVTVASDVTLILDDATVSASKITSSGTVKVEADKKLTLAGASLTGGALTILGTLTSSGTTTITDANISNLYLLESTLGGLLTLAATTSTPIISNDGGTIRANNAELDINGEAVTNTGTLAAINDGTLKLISTKVTNTDGTVSIEQDSTLDLSDATVTDGTLTISGTLQSTGTSGITDADITNTGTITVTGGTLTIDPVIVHTLTNHQLIQADSGELDISGEHIVNTAAIKAINGGILKLSGLGVTNDGGTVTVDGASKLYLTAASINGGSLNNSGNLYGVSGPNTISAGITNTGTIEVQAGTLNLSGGLAGVGSLVIDDGATLELAGATAQAVTFAGGADTLQLDKVVGQSFTCTITGQSSKAGTFTITGAADITTSINDALDFTASNGTSIKPATIVLTPTGTLKGAAGGIVVTQNGTGDVSLTATKDITGQAGNGITLRDSATTGVGNITIDNLTGKATGTGANSEGILVENLNAANAGDISITQLGGAVGGAFGIDATTQGNGDVTIDGGGHITGSSTYAIRARSYGSGDITVTTEAGSVVTSGSSGIVAVNRAISLDGANDSTITVNAYGAINSGSTANLSGNLPAGIQAGYTGSINGNAATTAVTGTVVINNHANITAAGGQGINAFNYGNGDITVNDGANTSVAGATDGIRAQQFSGGTGDVSVNLDTNASATGTSGYGIYASSASDGDIKVHVGAGSSITSGDDAIRANATGGHAGNINISLDTNVTVTSITGTGYGIIGYSEDQGNISITLATGDSITSASSGVIAVSYATTIADDADSTISVEAHGTIHSGKVLNNDGATPGGIIAGYKPGGTAGYSSQVNGDVTVTSDASITAGAGYGIEAFTWGVGDVTVTASAGSSITAAGVAISANDHGGGDVKVTNYGSVTGSTGIGALATGGGDVTIVNNGNVASTGTAAINVTQNDATAVGSTHITNTGTVVAPTGHTAIYIQENTTGSALIDNSGTIGPDAASVTSSTYAIVETGGAITINNTHQINGNISVASATFNNESGGTWTVSGTSMFGTLSSIHNAGEIDLHNGASVLSGDGVAFGITNSGAIESWGTASITGNITNTNTIEIHTDGMLSLFGSLSGSGSVTIDSGATLVVDAAVAQTVTFGGTGAELDIHTTSFGGSIAGLAATDKIDLSSIDYGLGTSAVYVANADASTGGTLTITDAKGDHISLTLTDADYSHAVFAGSNDGTGHTLITVNTLDDAPKFTADGAVLTASFSELADTTGASTTYDPLPAATGSIGFTDVDLTDLPTAKVTHQDVSWLDSDHSTLTLTPDEISALDAALSLQQTGKNNGSVGWSYSIADGTLDFLGEGQTATVVSTVTLDDGHKSDTTEITVTITGANDAPVITAEKNDSSGTDLSEVNAGLSAHGTLTVSDADATDHVTVTVDHLDIYFDGVLQTDYVGEPSNAVLLNYLTVQSGDILNGTATHAQFSWDFNSDGQAFDFLAAGHTLSLQYTIVPDDGHTPTGTGNGVVTINIAGSNDAPTLGDATLGAVVGNDIDPAGSSVSDLFTGKFHDVDDSASFKAIAVSADAATSDQGVWQYELAGTNQWVDIGSVSDTHALVLGTDTLIRFLPAEGFTGAPEALGVHALDDTYTGGITTAGSPATIDITDSGIGHGGTSPASAQAASISTDVTAPPDVLVANDDTLSNATAPSADAGWVLDIENGHYYRLVSTELSWGGAEAAAASDGAYLATITDQGEQDIITHLAAHTRAWIGAGSTDDTDGSSAHFYWLTGPEAGQALGYTHWRIDTNEPNGGSGTSTQYVHIEGVDDAANGGWNDAPGNASGRYFIEEWGGQQGQVAFHENVGTTLTTAQLLANDSDSAGNPITITSVGDLSGHSAHGGTVSFNGNIISYTPAADYFGADSFTYTVSDGSQSATATASFTVDQSPVIDATHFVHTHNEDGTDTLTDLSVSGSSTETYSLSVVTAGVGDGTSVSPSQDDGASLDQINADIASVNYSPGGSPPANDMITLTVTDSAGIKDTVNFIFSEGAEGPVTLNGTAGKDVIFATTTNDTLSGGGGKDQFVFAPGWAGSDGEEFSSPHYSHTITDFIEGLDKIDVRQFSDVGSINNLIITQQNGDTLVKWQQQVAVGEGSVTEHEQLLLKSVTATLKASDFIFHT